MNTADRKIRILQLDLDNIEKTEEQFGSFLDSEERDRAERMVFPESRARFVAVRGALRSVLGRALGEEPSKIPIEYGAQGKPDLAYAGSTNLHFNVSHSGGRAIIAVCRGRRVGIDLEQKRPRQNFLKLSARFFAPQEHAALCLLGPSQQLAGFYAIWTAKEALLKATGTGISGWLKSFAVTLDSNPGPIQFQTLAGEPLENEWSIWRPKDATLHKEYSWALALEGTDEPQLEFLTPE